MDGLYNTRYMFHIMYAIFTIKSFARGCSLHFQGGLILQQSRICRFEVMQLIILHGSVIPIFITINGISKHFKDFKRMISSLHIPC